MTREAIDITQRGMVILLGCRGRSMICFNLLNRLSIESVNSVLKTNIDVIVGECLSELKKIADNTYDCCVTSPPYYFVRDYGRDQQLGLEASPLDFVDKLTEVFSEVRRVMKPTGTLWLNIADNYCTRRAIRVDGKRTVAKGGEMETWAQAAKAGRTITGAQFRQLNIKEKDLFFVPHDLARCMRNDGWFARATFHWIKPVIVPEKERDAPSDAVEYVFLMTKADTGYTYNSNVLRELGKNGEGRQHRNVWIIEPSNYRSEHTATMPEELVARCILTGSKLGDRVLDPFGGVGTTGVVAKMLGRNADIIELNPDFAEIARNRIADTPFPTATERPADWLEW